MVEVIPPNKKGHQGKDPGNLTQAEYLHSRGEYLAWKDWMKVSNKYDVVKLLCNVATGAIVIGSWVAAANGFPAALCVDPIIIGGDVILQNKLEKASHNYWSENWIRPYRSSSGIDASGLVIDYDEKPGKSITKR